VEASGNTHWELTRGIEKTMSKAEWVRKAFEQYEGPLIRYAAHITGNTDQARDVVQDTFLKLCAAEQADVESHLAAWLYTVCRNRALDVRRKEVRVVSLDTNAASRRESGGPPAAALAEFHEMHSRVLGVVGTLSQDQQEVIRLKFQDALSYKEISQVTGHSVTNVGFLLHTAIRNIRARLANQADLRTAQEVEQ
jgi:RNA polymerase sigma factor (sigma-70 family)